ncbi:hypothetical protein ACHAPT_009281 [Fusarium lateritium]
MAIQKVAVVGASGNLGPKVVQALLDADFDVTAITRNESKATFPDKVTVKRVDITSVDSVKDAITGQDAVVSTAATAAAGAQKIIIDAVIAAKVPRFIPSEFGIPSREYRDTKIGGLLAPKIRNTDYLIELAAQHEWFSWTGISNGLFLDWSIRSGRSFVDLKNYKGTNVDSGNEPYSTSTLGFIGQAVAAVLKKPDDTANKYLDVAGVVTTQNEVLRIAEKVTGAKFDISRVSSAELEKIGDEKLARHDYSAFGEFIQQFLFADGAGHALKPEKSANGLLGLKEENLEEIVKSISDEL